MYVLFEKKLETLCEYLAKKKNLLKISIINRILDSLCI
jgi:hypothetical protein